MSQINDVMFKRLRELGYEGALPDMLDEYLAAQGVENKRQLYEANGFTSGHISDFAITFWPTAPAPTP